MKPGSNSKIASRPLSGDALATRSYSVQEQLIRQQGRVQLVQGLVTLFLIVAIVAVLVRLTQAQYTFDVGQKTQRSIFLTGRTR
jgi:hypothetical protein